MSRLSKHQNRSKRERLPRTNSQIQAHEVLLIDPSGTKIGVKTLEDAVWLANKLDFDLVEINKDSNPPVVKIMDYGKFRYEQSKKVREARKSRTPVLKTIQLSPSIAEGDYQTKLRQTKEFLEAAHCVTVTIRFRGRELNHVEIGRNVLSRFLEDTKEWGVADGSPRKEGRRLFIKLLPLRK